MCYWEDKADVLIQNSIKEKKELYETIQSKTKKTKKKVVNI